MICRCDEGFHGCWPGECPCTVCSTTPAMVAHQVTPKPVRKRKDHPQPKGVPHPTEKWVPLPEDLEEYIARQLIEDAGSPHRVSQPEWDAVHQRDRWTHREVADDLRITYERVRYIRKMPRPVTGHVAPAYANIAFRAGCNVTQVYKVMADLVVLRDGLHPEYGASFS